MVAEVEELVAAIMTGSRSFQNLPTGDCYEDAVCDKSTGSDASAAFGVRR